MRRTTTSAQADTPVPGDSGHQHQVADNDQFVRDLYQRHASMLRRYAAKLLGGDWHHAEDILQDAFARAWKHTDSFGGDVDQARPWLFTVVRNLVIDSHRARRIRPPENQLPDRPLAALGDETERILTSHVLLEVLNTLTEQQREVITLLYFRGHTVTQAAEVLGIPPGTVKSRTFYTMRLLRRELQERGVLHAGE
ncbi:sigma-70 family RNA polymerase sigma factor [Streptomyces sp. AC627_RSS907]|uniref:sigma-70 family RNA polymerase sigma factor n=1 Tax=Streptomyces sp. AC627_RSS907 TaxID=2823684 RepID=UPI001C23C7AA|nr:sigma-70 family RNA polymerase sigma factor [Streptomyces sp. AC627_RSS907]